MRVSFRPEGEIVLRSLTVVQDDKRTARELKVMLEIIVLIEFIVAFLMGLAACCFLFWGILDGAFDNLEEIKHRILEIEKNEP